MAEAKEPRGSAGRKRAIGIVSLATILLLPIAYTAFFAHGTNAYFECGRCMCGHDIFVHVVGDRYYHYSPGHGHPEYLCYNLRQRGDGWEMLALAPPPYAWTSFREGEVVARLKIHDGAIYECWSGTNWTRFPRVYNPYRIWIAKLLKE